MTSRPRLAYISSYPPRPCGLAHFTRDLRQGVASAGGDAGRVVAVVRSGDGHEYGQEVSCRLAADDVRSYGAAARHLNQGADVVSLQHEFGIYGGRYGWHVLKLVRALSVPLVTTLHTVPVRPDATQRRIIRALGRHSRRVVVMNRNAIQWLTRIYGLDPRRVAYVPHGAPLPPSESPARSKARWGWQDRTVLLSFGLVSPNKGFELVLEALPSLVPDYPELLYVIAGQTHPEVRRRSGEDYRRLLADKVRRYGLEGHVTFVDRHLDQSELCSRLHAADIFITPYRSPDQVTSGVLTYAVRFGKAVISTPYCHAIELLGDGAGILTPFDDVEALRGHLSRLLACPRTRETLARQAAGKGRNLDWRVVGDAYARIFCDCVTATSVS